MESKCSERHGFQAGQEEEGTDMDGEDERVRELVDGIRACPVASLSLGLDSETGAAAATVISEDYLLHP
jgi:hypothetical protein